MIEATPINKGSKKLDDILPVTTPPASNDKPKKLVGVASIITNNYLNEAFGVMALILETKIT